MTLTHSVNVAIVSTFLHVMALIITKMPTEWASARLILEQIRLKPWKLELRLRPTLVQTDQVQADP